MVSLVAIPVVFGPMEIVKHHRAPDFDTFVTAMFLMFARAPRKATPEIDGSYSLGEIGEAPEKKWTRLTPYSIARKEPNGDYQSNNSRVLELEA